MNDNILDKLKETEECLFINPVVNLIKNMDGICKYSIDDIYEAEERLIRFAPLLTKLFPELEKTKGIIESENIKVEPSATAGFYGPVALLKSQNHELIRKMKNATHIFWTTGGSMVPDEDYREFLNKSLL